MNRLAVDGGEAFCEEFRGKQSRPDRMSKETEA